MDWLRLNCRNTKKSPCSRINWGVVFPLGIWSLWLHRNSAVFGKERTRIDLKKEVMAKAMNKLISKQMEGLVVFAQL